jgi:hypothetical protein
MVLMKHRFSHSGTIAHAVVNSRWSKGTQPPRTLADKIKLVTRTKIPALGKKMRRWGPKGLAQGGC